MSSCLWFLTLLFFKTAFGCSQENYQSGFFNIIKNHRLTGHTIKTVFTDELVTCSQFCLREVKCLSLNFKTQGQEKSRLCELKDKQIQFGNEYNTQLVHDVNYDYAVKADAVTDCCSSNNVAVNCKELKNLGCPNGVYKINPDGGADMTVFCDQTTDGGGWTVFQRRVSPFKTDFYRLWVDYQLGFGKPDEEFWLGNDHVHRLTASGLINLRIDLTASGGQTGFAKYSGFYVADSSDNYRWNMTWKSGDIGNAIRNENPTWNQLGRMFSTRDRDNDGWSGGNCAIDRKSGWWFQYCGYSDLNQVTRPYWNSWMFKNNIIKSEMKLR